MRQNLRPFFEEYLSYAYKLAEASKDICQINDKSILVSNAEI